jgi:hypothetical protein
MVPQQRHWPRPRAIACPAACDLRLLLLLLPHTRARAWSSPGGGADQHSCLQALKGHNPPHTLVSLRPAVPACGVYAPARVFTPPTGALLARAHSLRLKWRER